MTALAHLGILALLATRRAAGVAVEGVAIATTLTVALPAVAWVLGLAVLADMLAPAKPAKPWADGHPAI